MFKKIGAVVLSLILLTNIYGCVAIMAGVAGGAGTAIWLSGKLIQQVNAPMDRTIRASESALRSLGLKITKETIKDDVAQIMSSYNDARTIWIDVRRVSRFSSQVAVRVGMRGDKAVAQRILDRITIYL